MTSHSYLAYVPTSTILSLSGRRSPQKGNIDELRLHILCYGLGGALRGLICNISRRPFIRGMSNNIGRDPGWSSSSSLLFHRVTPGPHHLPWDVFPRPCHPGRSGDSLWWHWGCSLWHIDLSTSPVAGWIGKQRWWINSGWATLQLKFSPLNYSILSRVRKHKNHYRSLSPMHPWHDPGMCR